MICDQCALCEEVEHDTCYCHAYGIYFSRCDSLTKFGCMDFEPKETEDLE